MIYPKASCGDPITQGYVNSILAMSRRWQERYNKALLRIAELEEALENAQK